MDVGRNIEAYMHDRGGSDRYASWDYCFNYFRSAREEGRLASIASGDQMEISCFELGFYLASWGMLRGGTDRFKHSAKIFEPVIRVIATSASQDWGIDANDYSDAACERLLGLRGRLWDAFGPKSTETLVTKVMLGVFGSVPALDQRFIEGWRRAMGSRPGSLDRHLLWQLAAFYLENAAVIERHRVPTLDFRTGLPTSRRYTRAKLIDMAFFMEGGSPGETNA